MEEIIEQKSIEHLSYKIDVTEYAEDTGEVKNGKPVLIKRQVVTINNFNGFKHFNVCDDNGTKINTVNEGINAAKRLIENAKRLNLI
jgi:hypothetical protein